MDAATHILDGLAIGVGLAKGKAHPVAVAAAGFLGALAPDVDTFFLLKGWDVYRMYHRVYTHTFWALPILAALVTLMVGFWIRFEGWKFLYWTALGAAVTHIILDMGPRFPLRFFWPFSDLNLATGAIPFHSPLVKLGFLASILLSVRLPIPWAYWATPGVLLLFLLGIGYRVFLRVG